eukprot:927565_1
MSIYLSGVLLVHVRLTYQTGSSYTIHADYHFHYFVHFDYFVHSQHSVFVLIYWRHHSDHHLMLVDWVVVDSAPVFDKPFLSPRSLYVPQQIHHFLCSSHVPC